MLYRLQIFSPVALLLLALALGACGRAPESAGPQKHYALTGKVVALNPKDHTATIDAAAIPNYMEAMTMEYPIRSKSEFEALHVGERIEATVNVREDGIYDLSGIHKQASTSPK
jgi:Cu/Ag efflux protein CusF